MSNFVEDKQIVGQVECKQVYTVIFSSGERDGYFTIYDQREILGSENIYAEGGPTTRAKIMPAGLYEKLLGYVVDNREFNTDRLSIEFPGTYDEFYDEFWNDL